MFSLKNKVVLVTGGTGTFGNEVVNRLLTTDVKTIRIFSRDEKKQVDMERKYNDSRLEFYIGSVRDKDSIKPSMRGVDFVFHAAALKHVPVGEKFPIEFVKTNCIGTENVLDVAIDEHVKKVIVLSTDKASYPINAMGMSKGLMEKIAIAKGKQNHNTVICLTRYGNVMRSRGSAIPLWEQQVKDNLPITITNENMTRFLMTIEEAVELVMYAFEHGTQGDLFVQKSPSATVKTTVEGIRSILSPKHKVIIQGIRHGEKLHEVLITKEEMLKSKDLGKYYVVNDTFTIDYDKYAEYNSKNTKVLNIEETISLLKIAGVKK